MARYILIDNASGYIWGDSADFMAGDQGDYTPAEVAQALDANVGALHGSTQYEDTTMAGLASNETGYYVYRADIDGSEAVTVVHDGQDAETIRAVVNSCRYVTSLRRVGGEG